MTKPQSQPTELNLNDHESLRTGFHLSRLFREMNKQLNAGVNYETILNFAFDALGAVIPFDRLGIALLEDEDRVIREIWVRSRVRVSFIQVGYAILVSASPSIEKILKTKSPRIINDLESYLSAYPDSMPTKLILKDGIRSSLTHPLIANGQPIGIVFFSSSQPGTYSHPHLTMINEVSDEISILVQYGRLHKTIAESGKREQVVRAMLHDLKAPLAVIQGFLDIIKEERWFENLDPHGKNLFQVIEKNSLYMAELIQNLSQMNRFNEGREELSLSEFNLLEFCNEMIESQNVLADKKMMTLTFRAEPNLPETIRADRPKLRQVVENLTSNAIKFSWPGSPITFSVSSKLGELIFSVEDHGQGIPDDEMVRLFHEFGKTSTTSTGGESSTGLGLAIAKKIVDAHGGKIWAQSKVNEGSTFGFSLPVPQHV